jgi:hypothetical protein
MPVLQEYMAYVKEGTLRSDVMQSAGWLIILGHQEYVREELSPEKPQKAGYSGWKCGSIEPLPQGVYPEDIGDAEHHYILDIENKTITHIKL